jgi:hypothetical protein
VHGCHTRGIGLDGAFLGHSAPPPKLSYRSVAL